MNWKRGLIRLWFVVSGLWIALWTIAFELNRHRSSYNYIAKVERYYGQDFVLIVPPIILLVSGLLFRWAILGFVKTPTLTTEEIIKEQQQAKRRRDLKEQRSKEFKKEFKTDMFDLIVGTSIGLVFLLIVGGLPFLIFPEEKALKVAALLLISFSSLYIFLWGVVEPSKGRGFYPYLKAFYLALKTPKAR